MSVAIKLKSPTELRIMREAGRIVAEIFALLPDQVRPGVSTAELDAFVEGEIRKRGARPSFLNYGHPPYPASICVAVNEQVVHGIPSQRQILREGDIVGIDIGVLLDGWIGDACVTYAIGTVDAKTARLMEVTQRCLELGMEQARPGKRIGDIGAAIQDYAEAQGFSVVREYRGYGVGRKLHEEPAVPHIGEPGTGLRLQPGMVFTIEPMINAGRPETRLMSDRWTVRTADGSRSAQFEHTLAITDDEPEILTLP